VKKIKPFIPLIFPILIILFGLIIYKIIGFEPNVYTITINLGLAFILSPRVKKNRQPNRYKRADYLAVL